MLMKRWLLAGACALALASILSTPLATYAADLPEAIVYEFDDRASFAVDGIGMLSERQTDDAQRIADQIEATAKGMSVRLTFDDLERGETVFAALDLLWEQAPELFYLSSVTVWQYDDGTCPYVTLAYCADADSVRDMISELDARVDEALAWADSRTLSDVDRAKALHDYIVRNVSYDSSESSPQVYGAYGALVEGRAVCGGYAEGYAVLLEAAGIEQTCVISKEMNHEWNIVTIDGESYHVDACWDDPVYADGSDGGFARDVRSTYFLVSDAYVRAHQHVGTWGETCDDARYEGATWDQYSGPIRPLYRFRDVAAGAWYVTSGTLERVVEEGLLNGYDAHAFGPNDALTRAQLACLLVNAFDDGEASTDEVATFTDVKEGSWYASAVGRVCELGWMSGVGDDRFAGGTEATREQVCAALWNVAGRPEPEGDVDVGASRWARDAVSWAVEEGIVGRGCDVSPRRACTRIEAATMALRLADALS